MSDVTTELKKAAQSEDTPNSELQTLTRQHIDASG